MVPGCGIFGIPHRCVVIRALASGAVVLRGDGVDELAGELEVVTPGDAGKVR
jgi:hypothetical protein